MSKWNLSWLVGMVLVAVVGLSLSYSAPNRVGSIQGKHQNLKLLVDVLEEVKESYVKDLDDDKMRDLVENMISGGLEKLDPHSNFIGADEYKQFQKQSRGKFGGIGIRIGVDRNGQIFVESPMVGTPAYEAGILAGDVIVKVEGQATDNLSLRKVVDTIQGDPGTKVTLTVVHEGDKKPVDIDIVRAEISIDSVLGDQRMQNNLKEWNFWIEPQTKIAYVRLTAFTETTVAELTKVVDVLQRTGMRGLVVDLRNNPGGLLTAAVEVSSVFLPEGKKVVSTKGRGNTQERTYKSQHENLNIKPGAAYPIAVLINRYSASASEIVAAALQDHLRAVIIGERSFGKGSVQNVIPMENNTTALKLTTASYWRPSGKNIHRFPDSKDDEDWGVKPNPGYEVKLPDEERIEYLKYRRDRDVIRRAGQEKKEVTKEEGKKEEGKKEEGKNAKAKEPFRDRVLDKALEYIHGELNKAGKENAQNPPPARAEETDDPAETLGAVEPRRMNPADRIIFRASPA